MTAHPAPSPGSGDAPADGPGKHWLSTAAHGAFPLDGDGRGRSGASGFAACALEADLQAASEARHFARSTLYAWGMAELVDNVAVIVSELLSNAIRYGLASPRRLPASPHPVWLGLLRRGETTVLCAVSDPSSDVPVLREPDYFAESGRGLHVIDSLSDSWGWTPPDHAGKTVWAAVSIPE
ncbi:ATP-binding protein [Streptomyces sp. RB6PN25]|uniref:ATP-binding protein n=1 Tax=Streptomyces humicola TaxID=2953240 RepID=A0ABT1Q0U1_9ACTN|nr:ATP-binding protein [Streptomyces humicola]MCQ4083548.1 ATP-binding protein [Streptomyces humicola]